MKAFICLCGIFTASSLFAAPYEGNTYPYSGQSYGGANPSTAQQTPDSRVFRNNGTQDAMDSRVFRNNDSWNASAESATTTTRASDRFTTGDDQKLGSQIRQQIVEIIGLPRASDVILYVDYGDVKLIGKVPSDEIKNRISQLIREIKGVRSLNNRLETANTATSGTSTTGFRQSPTQPLSATNPSTNSNSNIPASGTTYYRSSAPSHVNPSYQQDSTYYRSSSPSSPSVNSYYNRSSSSAAQSYTTPDQNPGNNIYNNPTYTGSSPSYTTPRQSYTGSTSNPTYNRY